MLRPLLSRRGDKVAVGLNDVDSQNSDPASTVNVRKSESISVNDSSIALSHITRPKSATPSVRKLRKKPPTRDGYESAGGYVSDKKATKEKSGDPMDTKVKKKKSFIQVISKFSNDVQSPSEGYETDGGAVLSSRKSVKIKKKSKTMDPSKEIGYDTDGGYQSENRKSKTRFFKLSTKSSKPDFHGPVPALPNSVEKGSESAVPLPIAGRFARTRTFSFSMPRPTTTESTEAHVDNPFPQISFQPSPAINDVASTTPSSSPVSAPSSTFERAQIAPMSDSPSAFNTHLHPGNRDSHTSSTSSSSGSGSNHHHKLQNKGLSSPMNSPPSSIQGHQLRPSLSLSSLNRLKPVISFPITRDTSPTSTNPPLSSTRSLHSLSVSPTSTSVRSSVSSSLQSKKPFRIKIHHPDLPKQQPPPARTVSSPSESGSPHLTTPTLPLIQSPRFAKVRPKNPPTDGFGPRSPLTSDSAALGSTFRPSPISSPILSPGFSPLSPNSHIQESSKRSSQQTIIPSSDYIVPSPRNSPLKSQYSGLPSPPVLTYHIPPPPSPAPRGPLPTPPSSCESGGSPEARNSSGSGSRGSRGSSSSGSMGQQPPFAVQLRQKMSKLNMQQSLLPSQSTTVATQPVSFGGGLSIEKTVIVGLRIEKKSGIGSSATDVPNFQKERLEEASLSRAAADSRQSWIDADEDTSFEDTLEVDDHQEMEEPEDLYEILDRFDSRDNENHHSSSSEHALERSHSFKAGKLTKKKRYHYPDNSFDARPPSQYVPAAIAAPDLYGFEDDEGSVGDRTSRWTESVYSRSSSGSILDEEESEERRGRLLRRVEAMLDAERSRVQETYVPPLPEIPQEFANIMHKQNGNNDNAGHRSNITPGRSWHKF